MAAPTQPRFSVIVAVHDVEGYVRACLDSVVDQSFDDFELIAVDDASTDRSGEIIDEVAASDPRVMPIHLDENVGLGLARNAGLEVATGEYVVFVDGDDWLNSEALALVNARLEKTDADVLVLDYARAYWNGRTRRNLREDIFHQRLPETFEAADRPEFLHMLMVAWNKVYRRSFIESLGLRFPPGYYEDTPWTYQTLISAKKITVLDRVCYYYRQDRAGRILQTPTRRHFDIFDQWTRLYQFLDQHPELESWRPMLFNRMVAHFLTILRQGHERIPEGDHREFFRLASQHYRRFWPDAHADPKGRAAVGHGLIRRDAYLGFRLAEGVRNTRARATARFRKIYLRTRKIAARAVILARLAVYRLVFVLAPVNPRLAVFASYWYRGYSGNPRAIYEALIATEGHRVKAVWVVAGQYRDVMPDHVPHVVEGTLRYYWALARAQYLVNDVNFPNFMVKRRRSVHVQTHHGTPLKTMGLDLARRPTAAETMDFEALIDRCDRWDYSISSNPLSSEVWKRVYPGTWENLEVGYPRNDRLRNHGPDEPTLVRQELGVPEARTTILYAPTHREYRRGFEPNINLTRFCRALPDEYLMLVRAHYFYEAEPPEELLALEREGLAIDVSRYPDVERLCLASDVLLTDYSSIMFDYANLERPIVVYADDWETYRRVRGTYFDLMATPPGPVATTHDELLDVFRNHSFDTEKAGRLRAQFRQRFCPWDDGQASERVVRRVFLGESLAPSDSPGAPAPPAS